jgi:hypothetical protein
MTATIMDALIIATMTDGSMAIAMTVSVVGGDFCERR